MKFKGVLIVIVVIGCLASSAPTVRADLAGDVRAVLRDKYLTKAEVGVAIARLSDGAAAATATASTGPASPEILFRHESDIPLMPASNLKIVTTSAFLDRFGPDWKFRTVLLMKDSDLFLI